MDFVPYDSSITIPDDALKIDNTKRSCASTCLRKYFYEHMLHVRPLIGSTALRYGIVWHEAMDAFYTHIKDFGWTRDGRAVQAAVMVAQRAWVEYTKESTFYDDYRTLSNLLRSLLQYISHFAHDEGILQVLHSERTFRIPIIPTEEEHEMFPDLEPFFFTGIIDLEVELNSRPWIFDHKTTAQELTRQSARLQRAAQFIGYSYAASITAEDRELPDGFLVVFHQLLARKSKKTQEYGEPKIDFQRSAQLFTEEDVADWRVSIMEQAERIQRSIRLNRWPMEFDSCYNFGQCPYTQLCDSHRPLDNLILDGYRISDPWDVEAEHKKKEKRRSEIRDNLLAVGGNAVNIEELAKSDKIKEEDDGS